MRDRFKRANLTTGALWALGAILTLAVAGYLGVRGLHQEPRAPIWYVPGGDAAEGRRLIEKYGCGSCHVIPGIREAVGKVGPDLGAFRRRMFIAGQAPNEPSNLVRWIQDPQDLAPGTAMPDLGVAEQEARDIAAYLYSLE